MPRRQKPYTPNKPNNRFVRPAFALLASLCVIGLPTWISASMLLSQPVSETLRYPGTIASEVDPASVIMPAEIAVGEILVREGDPVQAGQTLVTFDQTSLQALQQKLADQTAALVLERRCLLDPELFSAFSTDSFDALDDLSQLLGVALHACKARLSKTGPEFKSLSEDRHDLLQDRKRLLTRQNDLLIDAELQPGQVPDPIQLSAALRLQIEINEVDLKLNDLASSRFRIEQRTLFETQAHLQDLSQRIADNNADLERITDLLSRPGLIAPADGQVQRVRQLDEGTVLPQAAELMRIRPDLNGRLEVRFQADLDDRTDFDEGSEITLLVPHGIDPSKVRTARITSISVPDAGANTVNVRGSLALEEDDTTALDLAAVFEGAAIEVLITSPARSMNVATAQILHRNCEKLGIGTCASFFPETNEIGVVQ